ncbi:UNVERIFIED_CONTAM: hypothetical protein Sangu_1927200 [Sesamum angustifolium]|uniref:Uncharacterized protein n=1 Tax=Sesamum angustifolium TaxID=2727405 RepID=A0AAW2LX87_9LAMI
MRKGKGQWAGEGQNLGGRREGLGGGWGGAARGVGRWMGGARAGDGRRFARGWVGRWAAGAKWAGEGVGRRDGLGGGRAGWPAREGLERGGDGIIAPLHPPPPPPPSLSSPSSRNPDNTSEPLTHLKNSQKCPSPPPALHQNYHPAALPSPSPFLSKASLVAAVSAATLLAAYTISPSKDDQVLEYRGKTKTFYSEVETAIEKSNESINKIVNKMKQTGVAASVLLQSLRSVMSSANHEVRAGFELRVAALLADIVAASDSRRAAIVGAGGGAVVDWLLETVAVPKDGNGTQAESARALAYLIADPNVCEAVFGRPQAVPNLLRFIFSAQPPSSKKQSKRSSFGVSDKGKSMLVAAIMDVVTSNCDSVEKLSLKPLLPKNADIRDIAAAIEVIEEGGMHWDEKHGGEDDEDGGQGMKGIGMKVLGGTTVLGLSGTGGFAEVDHSDSYYTGMLKSEPKNQLLNKINESSPTQANMSSSVIPGLWDDLHSEHVAVPFAAWALANWAMASEVNRSHIQELDRDGHAVMSALMAPERSVKMAWELAGSVAFGGPKSAFK